MSGSVRLALALLPLAAYCFVLGVWQSGKKPRIIAGPADFGLLAFGLGGLIAFGPVGQLVVGMVFPRPSLPAWLAVASFEGLVAMIVAIRTRKRLVVYNVEAADLDRAVGLAMESIAGTASRTVRGFEDIPGHRGVTVEVSPRLRIGVMESHGEQPERLTEAIHPVLLARLSEVPSRTTPLAVVWFSLSFVALLIPVSVALMARPEVRAVIRRLGGR
ncbi:MAG: hypothetical protein JWN86_3559 [Planctomycetota bacterium]|nr:hypothetical protein [Planctomycetota bacterium]